MVIICFLNFLYPLSIYEYIDIFSLRFGLGTVVVHPDVTIDEPHYKKGGGLFLLYGRVLSDRWFSCNLLIIIRIFLKVFFKFRI